MSLRFILFLLSCYFLSAFIHLFLLVIHSFFYIFHPIFHLKLLFHCWSLFFILPSMILSYLTLCLLIRNHLCIFMLYQSILCFSLQVIYFLIRYLPLLKIHLDEHLTQCLDISHTLSFINIFLKFKKLFINNLIRELFSYLFRLIFLLFSTKNKLLF